MESRSKFPVLSYSAGGRAEYRASRFVVGDAMKWRIVVYCMFRAQGSNAASYAKIIFPVRMERSNC